MIEKIRRNLIIKYTAVIACILFLGFTASYAAYRHNGVKLLQDSLYDYLTEELWEAKEYFRHGGGKPEKHTINSDNSSLHNFTYWLLDGKIIRAEQPKDEALARQLEQRLLTKKYQSGKIYHENMKSGKQKWYFILTKQDIRISASQQVTVFVLANYTPVRKNAKAYIQIALFAAGIIIVLAYFVGSFFVSRSMKYIEQSYQKQKQFVSDAAHELRTPLTILYSYAELLEYNPRRTDLIADIKEEIQQMNEMVERLLDIARYDNSKIIIHHERFSVNRLVSSVMKSMSELCPKGTFELKSLSGNIELTADKVMVRQLFCILLDNAVKYTGKNKKIVITLEKNATSVKISIKDNGIGINNCDLPHIFDRFWRAEKSRHQKGLGLGLSLAEKIVNLHGGTIRAKSKLGYGTEFEIVLPIRLNKENKKIGVSARNELKC